MADEWAVTARGLVKRFGDRRVVDGVDLDVSRGSIYGVLGPNGAGKTTTLRMLLGIIEPDEGGRTVLGARHPRDAGDRIGYLPEERGLYPAMKAKEAIAFMGALRGLDWREGRRRAVAMLEGAGLGHAADEKIRKLSKGMAQIVQLLGSVVHRPDLLVLDEPFSGLDPVNQEKLEALIRAERVHYAPRADGPAIAALLPADAARENGGWRFEMPPDGVEPLLKRLIDAGHGIAGLSIERPGLHEAFVRIVGDANGDTAP